MKKKQLRNRKKKQAIWKKKLEKGLIIAGIYKPVDKVKLNIIKLTFLIVAVASVFLLYMFLFEWEFYLSYMFIVLALLWMLGFPLMLFLLWLLLVLVLDIRAYYRARRIEAVLPDFLQLTSANVRAGMIIEKALWHAVRPRFGVLAKEIDKVSKETMSGKPLEIALSEFASRYNSPTLKRAVALIIEGVNSGGEIGDLLNKVALNIQNTETIKREMAANVSTYAIFILVGAGIAAPLLFALTGQLLNVITSIFSNIEIPKTVSSSFPISFGSIGLSFNDFKIFAMTMLSICSFFASIIVSTIRKGSAKASIKLIPFLVCLSIGIFYIASSFMAKLFAELF